MSYTQYVNSPEGWQDFLIWDEEFYDPMVEDIPGFTGAQGFPDSYHVPGSVASEHPYQVSAPPSVVDGPSSSTYNISGPPSLLNGHSSFGQAYASLSYDTIATSPLIDQSNDQYIGSFGASDIDFSPQDRVVESPILDTRYEHIADSFQSSPGSLETTTETVFNPHVAGSSHSFNNLDVQASQAFSKVGTWVDQPQIIEPITECDEGRAEVSPIQIPQPVSGFGSYSSYPRSEGSYQQYSRTRAITIPEAARGAKSYNQINSHIQRTQRLIPTLSTSPVAQRLVRSYTLSRSNSSSRRKLTTPSPTDSLGWVSYHPNPLTNKLAPTSTEGLQGRTPRGRKRGLTAEQRQHAALMRIIGACTNCQKGKRKCDAGTPCKPCLEHYKGDLVNHPCRDRLLSDLSSAFFSDRLGWHPTARSLESFAVPNGFKVSPDITYKILLSFGFGTPLQVPVHALQFEDSSAPTLTHSHVVYSWPPTSSSGSLQTHAVLPAILATDPSFNLTRTLNDHLSLLVTHHFRAFPIFRSSLSILRDVYIFSQTISPGTNYARTLHQALKLLVLVHIGGDITLPTHGESTGLVQLIRHTMDLPEKASPTPCFIRAQFGAIMPGLALALMKEVLSSLEQLLLNRDSDDWPIALAILMVVLMTVESIHYHAAKLPYHNQYDTPRSHDSDEDLEVDDEGVKKLLTFYSACFSGCHTRLRPDWEGEPTQSHSRNNMTAEDTFIESVRDAIRSANGVCYLHKAHEKRQNGDMGFFFDRLVARLLLLKP